MATNDGKKQVSRPQSAAHESMVYRETPVDRLSGAVSKWVTVGAGEAGLVTQSGRLRKTLPPGRHKVGWRFWGLGSTGSFGVVPTSQFPLVLRFPHLGEEFKEPLDGFTQALVAIVDPGKFYRTVVNGRSQLSTGHLAGEVSRSALVILDRLAARFDPAHLLADPKAGERLSEQISGPLAEQLEAMGLRLVSLGGLLFKKSSESERVFEMAAQLQAELAGLKGEDAAAAAATLKKAQQFVDMAGESQVVSGEEREGLKSALDLASGLTGSPDFDALKNAFSQVFGGRSAGRARGLPSQESRYARAHPFSYGFLYSLESLLMVLPLLVLGADVLTWLLIGRPRGESWQTHHTIAGGLIIVLLISLKVVGTVRRHAQSRWAEQDRDVPWLKKWLTGDAARVDEITRQQVATSMEASAVPDIRAAADSCRKNGSREYEDSLRACADEARLLATNIRGAPRATAVLHSGSEAEVLQRGNRLIAFEEKTLALSRAITSRAAGLKAKALEGIPEKADITAAVGSVDALRRHFLSRDSVIAGLPWQEEPPAAAA